ncbi:MAG TPA: hypothetical protein VHP33_35470 [Polyangiaceae bacterium]|nr:hypothetical protein [Polyangiaceae bacterium]
MRKLRPPEITHADPPMRRTPRDRLLVTLLATGAVAVGCSRLTQPDWTLIQPSSAGTGAFHAGGAAGEATGGSFTPADGGEGGATNGGVGGEAGETNGGSAGKAGGAGTNPGGNAGTSGAGGTGGNAGTGSGGTSGSAGMAGNAGSGSAGAPPCTGTPSAVGDALVLFAGPAGASGARGGRAGLDAACEAERVKLNLTQTVTHAFITISGTDFIAQWGATVPGFQDVPKGRRIVGPTGIQVASSLVDLVDGSIEQSLECAKVFPVGTGSWISGNSASCDAVPPVCGKFETPEDTCNGWTLGTYDPLVQARFGSTTLTDNRWLTVATRNAPFLREACDVATDRTLCLAYTP